LTPLDDWLLESLDLLAAFQFTPEGAAILRSAPVELVPAARLADQRGARIVIPADVPAPAVPDRVWSVPFGATRLTLWNPIPLPGGGWEPCPSEAAPLWWRHPSGTLAPAWNLWANAQDLLTFREERDNPARDPHGRFAAQASPRRALGLLQVPVLNDANAALLDAAIALARGHPVRLAVPPELVRPVDLALSHDCDQLRGNDVYTQGVRAFRALGELAKGRPAQGFRHARAIVVNALAPRRYFAANLTGMFDVERQCGYRSVCYFLTGRRGRYGARSGVGAAVAFAATMPSGWEAGVHYNYGTVGSEGLLRQEAAVVERAFGSPVASGRAHYLKFDPVTDPVWLARNGFRYDESIGWPEHLAYRAGIAGPFRPFDAAAGRPLNLVEMPLMCMDAAVAATGGRERYRAMFDHLRAVGGVLSILFHPGSFHNPEHPVYDGLYREILAGAYAGGGRSWTPSEVLRTAEMWELDREARPRETRASRYFEPR